MRKYKACRWMTNILGKFKKHVSKLKDNVHMSIFLSEFACRMGKLASFIKRKNSLKLTLETKSQTADN